MACVHSLIHKPHTRGASTIILGILHCKMEHTCTGKAKMSFEQAYLIKQLIFTFFPLNMSLTVMVTKAQNCQQFRVPAGWMCGWATVAG